MPKKICGDCHVHEGQLHQYGCDLEICPACGGQFLGCDCGPDDEEGQAKWAQEQWYKRIPYVYQPPICALCGHEGWGVRPHVGANQMSFYLPPPLHEETICAACFDRIKALFPDGWQALATKQGPPPWEGEQDGAD